MVAVINEYFKEVIVYKCHLQDPHYSEDFTLLLISENLSSSLIVDTANPHL